MNVKVIALLSSASVMVLVDRAAGQNTREEASGVIRDLEIRASESLSRIPRIRSRNEAESTTISIKHKLLRSFGFDRIGGGPTAAPTGHIVGTLGRLGYRVDKVVFESFPGYFVTANVYVPGARAMSRAGKSPGIFILPDLRASSGKSDPVVQRLGHVMAKLGYLVFVFDPMGQGERRSASAEDAELLSLGVSPAGIDEYEIQCGLAYLASLIGVDTGRIGFVSWGGSTFRALAVMSHDLCPGSGQFSSH